MSDTIGYIKIGSIKGDATDENHKEWIELMGVSHSIFRNVDATRSPQEALSVSKAVVNAIEIQKKGDSSSPEFVKAICEGKVFPEVELHLTKTTPNGQASYYTWKMTDVYVSSYTFGCSGGGGVQSLENFSLCFSTMKWDYAKTKPDGSAGGNVKAGWDVAKNKVL